MINGYAARFFFMLLVFVCMMENMTRLKSTFFSIILWFIRMADKKSRTFSTTAEIMQKDDDEIQ